MKGTNLLKLYPKTAIELKRHFRNAEDIIDTTPDSLFNVFAKHDINVSVFPNEKEMGWGYKITPYSILSNIKFSTQKECSYCAILDAVILLERKLK